MDYSERFMWLLTSASTCYSGAEIQDGTLRARFAIEWHACLLEFDDDVNHKPSLTWREITESEADSLVCVGYSTSNLWECLALVDLSKMQPALSEAFVYETGNTRDNDDQSISTTVYTRASLDSSAHDPRRIALESLSGAVVTGPTGNLTESNSQHARLPNFPSNGPVAMLILRKLIVQDDMELQTEYTTALDFRPLAPTICQLAASNAASHPSIGIWLGSSDDAKLHWFEPDSVANSLNERKISDDPAFQFISPVMAISFQEIVDGERMRNCLAVGCQDGTMRTILFDCDSQGTLVDIKFHQVIVDGPIICCDLQYVPSEALGNKMKVTAGSLCGYVMELYVEPLTCDTQGPFVVAEGFWNAVVNAEDSVVAVKASMDKVLVGTQSGRLLIYGADQESNTEQRVPPSSREYQLLWQCQLPYSIHSVSWLQDTDRLLVTTRRSLHVFEKTKAFDYKATAEKIKSNLLRAMTECEKELHLTTTANDGTNENNDTIRPAVIDAPATETDLRE